jgi:hypothetical protein
MTGATSPAIGATWRATSGVSEARERLPSNSRE